MAKQVDPLQQFLTAIGGADKAKELARKILALSEEEQASSEPVDEGKDSPLQEFIRKLGTKENREAFVKDVSDIRGEEDKPMSLLRLYQIAGLRDPNPTLRIARALVLASEKWGEQLKIEPLKYEDLLIGKTSASRRAPKG